MEKNNEPTPELQKQQARKEKLERLWTLTASVYEKLLMKAEAGEIELNGHALKQINDFLMQNKMTFQAIQEQLNSLHEELEYVDEEKQQVEDMHRMLEDAQAELAQELDAYKTGSPALDGGLNKELKQIQRTLFPYEEMGIPEDMRKEPLEERQVSGEADEKWRQLDIYN